MDWGSSPLKPNEDGLAIMIVASLVAGDDGGTYKNPE
jgi:hypothetical protein